MPYTSGGSLELIPATNFRVDRTVLAVLLSNQMVKNPILVLAGTRQEYLDYIKSQGASDPIDPRWASGLSPFDTGGHYFSKIVAVGTFWDRADAKMVYAMAQARTEKENTKMQ